MSFFDKVRRQKFLSLTLILFTLSIGVVIGTVVSTGVKAAKENTVAPNATPLTIPNPVQLSTQFTTIAKQVEPSVVNISTEYLPKQQPQARNRRRQMPQQNPDDEDNDNGMDDFFFRFFGNPFGGGGGGGIGPDQPGPRGGAALGSGVVVDRGGYILTNNHVVEKADRIRVKFTGDPTEYDAKVVGTDPATDLAVIRVTGKNNLVPARIGNSDAVQVGDWAVAIGSPFGFQATVTAGIISAKERDVDPTMQFQHFLQTDAAINPGNSGGPLLNINGEVIGINTAIATRSGGYQGIGFALPINTAANVYNQIIKTGKVTRGSIGVRFQDTNTTAARDLLKAYGATAGVFVQSVEPGGPADKAGVKPEDIITAINGKPIASGGDLVNTVTETPVGKTIDITVLRNGKKQDFHVTVADRSQVVPNEFGRNNNEEQNQGQSTQAKFGISIQNLTAERRQALGVKESGGVLIDSVEPGSFADDVGLQPRMILLAINRQPVNSVDDVKRIQATLKPGDPVAFRVLVNAGARQGQGQGQGAANWTPLFLAGTLPNSQ